jgi:formamidopyrimidine-DNA glycosylase
MPELPEVQTTVDGINARVKGLVISSAWTDYGGANHADKDEIKNLAFFARFKKAVTGARVEQATRRGKNILIHLSNGKVILVHMKMTGHMMHGRYDKKWRPVDPHDAALNDPFNRFVHFALSFPDGTSLVLCDMRKFAKVTLVDADTLGESEHLRHHGPEPLDETFGVDDLIKAVSRKPNEAIKTVLMDHTVVAGIGNIYSDEILWRTGIHPLEPISNISKTQWKKVLEAAKDLLQQGIDFGGDSMSDYRNIDGKKGEFQGKHKAYRKTGSACERKGCDGIITRLVVGGRSAHFCSTHQTLRKVA